MYNEKVEDISYLNSISYYLFLELKDAYLKIC